MISFAAWYKENSTILKELFIEEFPNNAHHLDGIFKFARDLYDDFRFGISE